MGRVRVCCLCFLALLHISKTYTGDIFEGHIVSSEQKAVPAQITSAAVRPWTGHGEFPKEPPVLRPYHVFPMFEHVPVPLVDMELFRPESGRRRLPNVLSSVLVPQVNPQRIRVSPVGNTHGVEVWCGYSKVSVRVNKMLLGFRSSPACFYLGTCSVSRSDEDFIYFHYELNECGGSLTMMNGQIIYSNTLQYMPEPQGTVIRAVPLTLNIQCLYNRFHYSYKMGFLPVIRERIFHKTFESRAKFTISVCNEHWEKLRENESFMLGEPVYFEVFGAHISKSERIFVDSCYAASSKDPNAAPKHSIIHNYGCMGDSRRHGSLSRFLQRQSNFLRFSIDAFLLPQVTGKHFYLHCLVSVHNTAASASVKSCTYNSIKKSWEELYTDASVCACCESTCEVETKSSLPHVTQSLITSKSWILNKTEASFTQHKEEWFSTQNSTEKVRVKSTHKFNEDEDYIEEIVTDTDEQMEMTEKYKVMPMNDAEEEIEVIAGTEATFTEFQEKVAVRSGEVMFSGDQMEKNVNVNMDMESVSSTIKTETVEKASVQSINETLDNANDDEKSSVSVPEEEVSRYKMQPDDLEKNINVQSATHSPMLIDEDMFLNAKQEPMEWSKDALEQMRVK